MGDTTYKFALEFADDEASEDKAVQAYNTVMDKGANAIMGCVTSGACIAIVDQTYQDGILQVTPSGSAEAVLPMTMLSASASQIRSRARQWQITRLILWD